jgi:hypothetical protein
VQFSGRNIFDLNKKICVEDETCRALKAIKFYSAFEPKL